MQEAQSDLIVKIFKEQKEKIELIIQNNKHIEYFQWYISTGNLLRDLLGIDNVYTKGFTQGSQFNSEKIKNISDLENNIQTAASYAIILLNALIDDYGTKAKHQIIVSNLPTLNSSQNPQNRMIFIVHGHNEVLKRDIEDFLISLELESIILHKEPAMGKTIIEKVEHYAKKVKYAIVILSQDDLGCTLSQPHIISYTKERGGFFSKKETVTHEGKFWGKQRYRARQNVIFELGFFIGYLGRENVVALCEEEIERPSDIDGIVYIPLNKEWKLSLVKELLEAKFAIDEEKSNVYMGS